MQMDGGSAEQKLLGSGDICFRILSAGLADGRFFTMNRGFKSKAWLQVIIGALTLMAHHAV